MEKIKQTIKKQTALDNMIQEININKEVCSAVNLICKAILQSQERAVKAVNQEQLALYYRPIRQLQLPKLMSLRQSQLAN